MLETGNKVKGIFSGRYLGVLIRMKDNDALIRAPDGSVIACSPLMIERVPDRTIEEIPRVWVI
jgi:hypothetical protein